MALQISGRGRKLLLFCLANLFGGSVYAWSLFAVPIAAELSRAGVPATPADLAFAFSLAMAGTPIGMVAGGWLNDRFGPRASLPFGALFMFTGLALAARAPSALLVNLAYGLVYGIGSGANFTSSTANAIRLFPERRGLASGLATMAFGMSSIAAPVLAGFLLSRLATVDAVTAFAGIVAAAVACCGLAAGRIPEAPKTPSQAGPRVKGFSCGPREMAKTPLFWLLFLFMAGETIAGMALFSQMAGIARSQIGLSAALCALSVSALALANTCGRFIAGAASDRFGRIETLLAMATAGIVGLLALSLAREGDAAIFFLGLACIGLPFGGFMGIYPSIVAELFGTAHMSVNYGFMAFSYTLAGFAGPVLLRALDGTGAGALPYLALAALSAAGLLAGAAALAAARRWKARR